MHHSSRLQQTSTNIAPLDPSPAPLSPSPLPHSTPFLLSPYRMHPSPLEAFPCPPPFLTACVYQSCPFAPVSLANANKRKVLGRGGPLFFPPPPSSLRVHYKPTTPAAQPWTHPAPPPTPRHTSLTYPPRACLPACPPACLFVPQFPYRISWLPLS